jgi:hypothetical protein
MRTSLQHRSTHVTLRQGYEARADLGALRDYSDVVRLPRKIPNSSLTAINATLSDITKEPGNERWRLTSDRTLLSVRLKL